MFEDRIRCAALRDKVTTAAEAARLIGDGMRVGASGFTRAGDAKAVPAALAERVRVKRFGKMAQSPTLNLNIFTSLRASCTCRN